MEFIQLKDVRYKVSPAFAPIIREIKKEKSTEDLASMSEKEFVRLVNQYLKLA